MTPQQKQWLDSHAEFEVVRPLGVISLHGYADQGFLLQNGEKVDGELRNWCGLRVIAAGDTLHTNVKGEVRVGRRFDIV